MSERTRRKETLAAHGVIEPGAEPAFDRLARLAVLATRAPICAILLGDDGYIKGYSGPRDAPLDRVTAPAALYADVLQGGTALAEARDDVAIAVIRATDGTRVGCVCARTLSARTWTPESLEALSDVASLAQVELELRARSRPAEKSALILESISDACVFMDRDFRYTYVNRKAGEIFGRSPSSLLGKHIWTEFPEGIGQKFYHAYLRAMEQQVPVSLVEYYPPWNRWFENRIYPSPDGLAIFFQDITEKRQSELERSRLASIVEASEDLFLISNAEGLVLRVNPKGREMLGLTGEADAAHLVALHSPKERDRICEAMEQAAKGQVFRGESVLSGRGGERIPVLETLTWHGADAPDVGYFSLRARDLREQVRARDELARAAELRAQAEHLAHLGYWVWEIPTNRVTWSPELYRIYGLDSASFGASFEGYLARLHPEDRARVRGVIERALAERVPFVFEERIVRPSGELRHLRSWGSVSVDDRGQPRELFGTCLDMTELVVATEGLRRTQEWLATTLSTTGIAVWEWNVQSNDVRFSDGAPAALGLREEDLKSTFDAYLHSVHPDDRPRLMEGLRESVEGNVDLESEHRLVSGGTERWILARARPRSSPGGRVDHLVGTFVDVTERHRAEAERRALLERLAQAQKMEAIGRLSAGVAHDFNNHLTIVLSAVEHLLRMPSLEAGARELVGNIEEAVRGCTSLTSQFLSFSRDQRRPPSLVSLNLNRLVQESIGLLKRLLPANVTLEFLPDPSLTPILGDSMQLDRVLLNLVVNARDAMPGGGRVTITTEEHPGEAVLQIRDTGVGMSPEVQAQIFEPFFTTKGARHGTGLGLTTVYGIVTQSGGRIEVESQPDAGSTFRIHLPHPGPPKGS